LLLESSQLQNKFEKNELVKKNNRSRKVIWMIEISNIRDMSKNRSLFFVDEKVVASIIKKRLTQCKVNAIIKIRKTPTRVYVKKI